MTVLPFRRVSLAEMEGWSPDRRGMFFKERTEGLEPVEKNKGQVENY